MENIKNTDYQYDAVVKECREIYVKKLRDYGAAWRIMRPSSVTDQIFIKASRIRTLETEKEHKINEGIRPELIGIINYAVMGLIQLELGYSEGDDIAIERAIELYDKHIEATHNLMRNKNHDYGEAWRGMRNGSYTDLILMKIHRTKQIEDNNGQTLISEGVDANYADMINYAIFYMIKMSENEGLL